MKQNLDVLKTEIREYLENAKFVVFYGHSRSLDPGAYVYWDVTGHPDYRKFLGTAEAAGVKLIVLHAREFSADYVDHALDRLEDSDLGVDERRAIERRLRDMRAYDGFTCALELSFDYQAKAYIFDLRTEWYQEFSDMLDEVDSSLADDAEDDDEGPIGGYFSKN